MEFFVVGLGILEYVWYLWYTYDILSCKNDDRVAWITLLK